MNTTFQITPDLSAFMERAGPGYTGNLIVRSEKLDDYDIYRINPEGYWDLDFDSLTNKSDKLELPEAADKNSGGWTGWLWEEVEGFAAWAEEMKAWAPAPMKLPALEEVKDLDYITPPREQGSANCAGYAMHEGLIILRWFTWDENAFGKITNTRHEFTAYVDGDPDAPFEPWNDTPLLGEALGEIGSIPA